MERRQPSCLQQPIIALFFLPTPCTSDHALISPELDLAFVVCIVHTSSAWLCPCSLCTLLGSHLITHSACCSCLVTHSALSLCPPYIGNTEPLLLSIWCPIASSVQPALPLCTLRFWHHTLSANHSHSVYSWPSLVTDIYSRPASMLPLCLSALGSICTLTEIPISLHPSNLPHCRSFIFH